MAAPVVLGVATTAGLTALGRALLASIVALLIKLALARVALRILGYGLLIALLTGLWAQFNNWLSPLVQQLFSNPYGQFLGLVFPPVSGSCIAIIVAAWTAVSVYRLKVRLVQHTTGI